jgi:hypothetical protein
VTDERRAFSVTKCAREACLHVVGRGVGGAKVGSGVGANVGYRVFISPCFSQNSTGKHGCFSKPSTATAGDPVAREACLLATSHTPTVNECTNQQSATALRMRGGLPCVVPITVSV